MLDCGLISFSFKRFLRRSIDAKNIFCVPADRFTCGSCFRPRSNWSESRGGQEGNHGIEDEKVAGLLRGGSEPVDWIVKYDAEDIAQTDVDGSTPNKAQIEAGLQPGVFKMHSMKQDGHHFRVYDNGNVAVVTYHALGVVERNGKSVNRENLFSDVWVKQKGAWLRVLHQERDMPKPKE